MFYQYFKLNILETIERYAALFLVLTLALSPVYPLQVIAEETSLNLSQEESATESATPAINQSQTEQVSGGGDAVVNTGNATAETEILNEANTNIVGSEISTENGLESPTEGSGEEVPLESTVQTNEGTGIQTEEVATEEQFGSGDTPGSDTLLENEATVKNEAETAAETGENSALSEEGKALIGTGDAFASTNAVSVVNLNLAESNGLLYLLNNFLGSLGHVDLRPLASSPETANSDNPCIPPDCDALNTSLETEIKNNATISNVLLTRSETGNNSAEGGTGSLILTGNAYAGTNLMNIANTNIIDSNYLLFAFNNFGNWNGDLILPNAEFFTSFFSRTGSTSEMTLENNNESSIENNVEVLADTGGNSAEGEGVVETGEALSNANVLNTVNTNLTNTSVFYVAFRIFGSWNGSVFNAPEGVSWIETPSGVELFSDGTSPVNGTVISGETDIKTENTASIANNVKVFALTGANKAVSEGGTASVSTGNAYAGANVLNVANTNVISSNWVLALINIFGDWSGNVSFGQPDLWIGTQVEGPEILRIGSEAVFHTTVANRGDAKASNVLFKGSLNSSLVGLEDEDYGASYSQNIGSILPGEVKEFSYRARVSDLIPPGRSFIDHTLEVSADETDANTVDNSDLVSLVALRQSSRRSAGKASTYTITVPSLEVTKTNSAAGPVSASEAVDYTIVVKNKGGSAFAGILYDVLKDKEGNVVTQNNWELGEIFPNEEITMTYTMNFKENAAPGIYTNSAWVLAYGGGYQEDPALGTNADSNIATSSVTIFKEEIEIPAIPAEGEVLGASCGLSLEKFLRQGIENDREQVKKLQELLNEYMNANLPITGFYGPLTFRAVKELQKKYADEILAPWNIKDPTGIVYQTTQRWINKLECPEASIEMPILISWSKNPNAPFVSTLY